MAWGSTLVEANVAEGVTRVMHIRQRGFWGKRPEVQQRRRGWLQLEDHERRGAEHSRAGSPAFSMSDAEWIMGSWIEDGVC